MENRRCIWTSTAISRRRRSRCESRPTNLRRRCCGRQHSSWTSWRHSVLYGPLATDGFGGRCPNGKTNHPVARLHRRREVTGQEATFLFDPVAICCTHDCAGTGLGVDEERGACLACALMHACDAPVPGPHQVLFVRHRLEPSTVIRNLEGDSLRLVRDADTHVGGRPMAGRIVDRLLRNAEERAPVHLRGRSYSGSSAYHASASARTGSSHASLVSPNGAKQTTSPTMVPFVNSSS